MQSYLFTHTAFICTYQPHKIGAFEMAGQLHHKTAVDNSKIVQQHENQATCKGITGNNPQQGAATLFTPIQKARNRPSGPVL
jgi:hypothetical protein